MPCGTTFERWHPYCHPSNHQVTNEVSKILSDQDRKNLMALRAWLLCDMNWRKFSAEVAGVGPATWGWMGLWRGMNRGPKNTSSTFWGNERKF